MQTIRTHQKWKCKIEFAVRCGTNVSLCYLLAQFLHLAFSITALTRIDPDPQDTVDFKLNMMVIFIVLGHYLNDLQSPQNCVSNQPPEQRVEQIWRK